MWKRCPNKKTLDAFIHFHTLSYALEGFTGFYILSNIVIYTFLRFYMLSYAFHTLSYTFIRFLHAFIHIQTQRSKTSPPLAKRPKNARYRKAQPLRGWQKTRTVGTFRIPGCQKSVQKSLKLWPMIRLFDYHTGQSFQATLRSLQSNWKAVRSFLTGNCRMVMRWRTKWWRRRPRVLTSFPHPLRTYHSKWGQQFLLEGWSSTHHSIWALLQAAALRRPWQIIFMTLPMK